MIPEQTLLGGALVYPGHPVPLAYLIMRAYPDLETALARDGDSPWPAALGNQAIPGGGGEVRAALTLLTAIRDGSSPAEAVAKSSARWRDGRAGGHPRAVDPGQAQAEHVLARFYALLDSWLPEQDRAVVLPAPASEAVCRPSWTR